ncbi:MAG: OPT/YSL family transporter, partial [Gemmatimonadetes bacterium]|nr:OPT/YSL family transporter [Gemmatimonadota bacterium]
VMIGIGAAVAAVVIAIDKTLETRGSDIRIPVLAVAVGIYLPLELEVPIFVGGMVAWLVGRAISGRGGGEAAVERASQRGLLFASGLITGEALVGILLAIPFAAAQSTDVLTIAPDGFEDAARWIGLAAGIAFTLWLYRVSLRASD